MRIGYYKGKGTIFDKAIRWWTRPHFWRFWEMGTYSHTYFVFSDGLKTEAKPFAGVIATPMGNTADSDFIKLNLLPAKEQALRRWALDRRWRNAEQTKKRGYDYLGIFLAHFIPLKINDNGRDFYSENIILGLQHVGELPGDIEAFRYNPDECFDLVEGYFP